MLADASVTRPADARPPDNVEVVDRAGIIDGVGDGAVQQTES